MCMFVNDFIMEDISMLHPDYVPSIVLWLCDASVVLVPDEASHTLIWDAGYVALFSFTASKFVMAV